MFMVRLNAATQFFPVFYSLFLRDLPGGCKLERALAKTRRSLVPASVYASDKKLNLGSGLHPLPRYVNVDILPERHPDIVASVEELSFSEDGQWDLVRASHVLEHFPFSRGLEVLAEWARVIRPGGYLVLCVPDYVRLSWRAIFRPEHFDPLSYADPQKSLDWLNGLFALDLPPAHRHQMVFTHQNIRSMLRYVGLEYVGRQTWLVEEPASLGIQDDSCGYYSINVVARKPV